jgi:hypothetical protein
VLSSGSLLDNRYRLDERIATGGMGDVWRGTDVVLGRTVAVKVLRTGADPELLHRLDREARAALVIYLEGLALAIAALAILLPPVSLVVVGAAVVLLLRGRRRDQRKYAGLRVLR